MSNIEIDPLVHPQAPFDPAAGLPETLLSRIDSWRISAPKSQFQQYGPLNAYLQGHKFSSKSFLVKPQALLRCLATNAQVEAHRKRTQEAKKSKSRGKKEPRYSLDPHGELATKIRLYPDFDIDQYYEEESFRCDIVRVVVEIGSLLTAKSLQDAQRTTLGNLMRYLKAVGNRAHGRLLGIGIAGNTVCVVQISRIGWMKRGLDDGISTRAEWFSFFDSRLTKALDDMVEFCETDDPFSDHDENSFCPFGELVSEAGRDREEEEGEEEEEEEEEEQDRSYGWENEAGHQGYSGGNQEHFENMEVEMDE